MDTNTPAHQAVYTFVQEIRRLAAVVEEHQDEWDEDPDGAMMRVMIEASISRDVLANVVDWSVLAMREDGEPWDQIARCLGVSRQGAHKAYSTLTWSTTKAGAMKWREPKLPTT